MKVVERYEDGSLVVQMSAHEFELVEKAAKQIAELAAERDGLARERDEQYQRAARAQAALRDTFKRLEKALHEATPRRP